MAILKTKPLESVSNIFSWIEQVVKNIKKKKKKFVTNQTIVCRLLILCGGVNFNVKGINLTYYFCLVQGSPTCGSPAGAKLKTFGCTKCWEL